MDIGLHHLRAFVAVAENSSFTKAARSLHLSQPALSNVVRQLEETLGMRLFDRTTRRVVCTDRGAEFLPTAHKLLQEFDDAIDSVKAFARLERGHVRLALVGSMATHLLPPVFQDFTRRYPDIGLSLYDANAQGVQRMVKDGTADFGLASRWEEDAELDFVPLLRDRFGVVCCAEHPLAEASEPVPWQDLAQFPCFGGGGDTGIGLAPLLAASTTVPRNVTHPHYQVFNLVTMASLLQAGLGVTALPRLEIPLTAGAPLVFRELKDPVVSREICLMTKQGRSLPPAGQQLCHQLTSHLMKGKLGRMDGVEIMVDKKF